MSSVVIMNLGNRDLQVKDECVDNMKELFDSDLKMTKILGEYKKIPSEFKEFTRILFESFDNKHDEWIKYIEFPIIKATLEKLNDKGKVVDKIIFIASDQSDTNYSKTDTKYLAEILLKLKPEYNELFKISTDVDVEIKKLTKNPSDYDITIEGYKKILDEFKEVENIYIGITGGTPAMSTALLINSINTCDNVMTIYTKKKENNKQQAYALNLAQELKKNESKKNIIKFINAQNYSAAEMLIKEFKDKFPDNNIIIENVILNIVKAAASRIQFDFGIAKKAIEEVIDNDCDSREIYEQFVNSIEELTSGNEEYLLNEVINNAEYQYNIGAYTDFLGRIFRIQEEIYKYILNDEGILKSDGKLKQKYLLENFPCLEQEFKIKRIDTRTVDKLIERIYDNNSLIDQVFDTEEKCINTIKLCEVDEEIAEKFINAKMDNPGMEKILEKILEDSTTKKDLFNYCNLLTELKQLRNKSILAHGYEGVSKDKIKEKLKNKLPNDMSIEQFLKELIEKFKDAFNLEIYTDDFYKKNGEFNKHLIKLIEEL